MLVLAKAVPLAGRNATSVATSFQTAWSSVVRGGGGLLCRVGRAASTGAARTAAEAAAATMPGWTSNQGETRTMFAVDCHAGGEPVRPPSPLPPSPRAVRVCVIGGWCVCAQMCTDVRACTRARVDMYVCGWLGGNFFLFF